MIRSLFLLVAVGLCAAAFSVMPTLADTPAVERSDRSPFVGGAIVGGSFLVVAGIAAMIRGDRQPARLPAATRRFDDSYWISAAPLSSRLEVGTRPKGA